MIDMRKLKRILCELLGSIFGFLGLSRMRLQTESWILLIKFSPYGPAATGGCDLLLAGCLDVADQLVVYLYYYHHLYIHSVTQTYRDNPFINADFFDNTTNYLAST